MDFGALFLTSFAFIIKSLIVLGTLSILVVIHEFGHFIAARFFGVKVFEFSFGMGKILFSKQVGDTDYQIRAIPMGGFVKLAGEDSIFENEYRPLPYEFYGIPPLKRLLIVFAGPLLNFLLAFFAFLIVIFFMGENLTKPIVGYLHENSPAYIAGIKTGDTIIAIDGKSIESFEDASEIIFKNKNEKMLINVLRNNENLKMEVIPELKIKKDMFEDMLEYGDIGLNFYLKPYVGEILEGSPAAKLNLQEKDLIVSVNGKTILFWDELLQEIQANPKKRISLEWKRGDEILKGSILSEKQEILDDDGITIKSIGKIGLQAYFDQDIMFHKDVSFINAFYQSGSKIFFSTYITYKVLKKLISGKFSKDNLMGPVRLAGMVTDFAENGFLPWLLLLGFISHQLAIINFLPFPALDGGHAMFFLVEFITGKRLDFKVQDTINRIGFSLLITLFIFVIFNDVINLIGKS